MRQPDRSRRRAEEKGQSTNLDRWLRFFKKRSMPRHVRVEYPGAFYHVMARGDRGENIFLDDKDREQILRTLAQACAKTGWRIHAWVLMTNHYHWLVETPQANLVEGMRWLQNTYTRSFNHRHKLWGHVFGGRYKAVLVESDLESAYFGNLWDYIHLNPVRGGLVDPKEGAALLDYRWSSLAQVYAAVPTRRPAWSATERAFAAFGCKDSVAGRRKLIERLEQRAVTEEAEKCGWIVRDGQSLNSTLRRGWYWGSQIFRQKVLALAAEGLHRLANRSRRTTDQWRDHAQHSATDLIRQGLKMLGLSEARLKATKGSEPRKVSLAWAVARSTTLSQTWIADRLHMRSAANVSQQVRRFESQLKRQTDPRIKRWIKSVKTC
jgi:putative transposase